MTATDPCFAAFSAKLSPAIPLPITTKSYSFIPTEYCRSNAFCRSKPRAQGASLAERIRSAAKFSHQQARHINPRKRRCANYLLRKADNLVHSFFFRIFRGQQGFAQHRSLLAFLGIQIRVP